MSGREKKGAGAAAGYEVRKCGFRPPIVQDYIVVDPRLLRPAEVELLLGDASKAEDVLGWRYTRTLDKLVQEVVDADMALPAD